MKRIVTATAFAVALLLPALSAPVFAAGGSGGGGGGGTTSGGGTTTGGTTTGGGGGVKTCSPSVVVTAAQSSDPATPRALNIGFTANCASRSHVVVSATNTRTNVLEWSVPDNNLTNFIWSYPQCGTQYRIEARVYDNATNAQTAIGSTQVSSRNLPANCGPTLTVNPSVGTTVADWNITVGVGTFWCQGPTNIVVTATNTTTGVQEFRQSLAAGASAVVLPRPRANTTYNIVATAYDPLNGSALISATGSVAVGPYPANCGPNLSIASNAGATAADWGVTVTSTVQWCFGPANVYVTLTNAATGVTEYSGYADPVSLTATFLRPTGAATYTITATATDASNGAPLATATGSVIVPATPPNCARITNQNVTTGYWGIYAAIWISTSALDCGYGSTSIHVKVTNTNSGQVEYEVWNMGMQSLLDFEGPVVKYSTPYQFDVDIRGMNNEILDSRSQIVTSSPLR